MLCAGPRKQILYTRGGAEHLATANKYLCRAVELSEPNGHLLWGLLTVGPAPFRFRQSWSRS